MTNLCLRTFRLVCIGVLLSIPSFAAPHLSEVPEKDAENTPCYIFKDEIDSASTLIKIRRLDQQNNVAILLKQLGNKVDFQNNGADSIQAYFNDVEPSSMTWLKDATSISNKMKDDDHYFFYISKAIPKNYFDLNTAIGGLAGLLLGLIILMATRKGNSEPKMNMTEFLAELKKATGFDPGQDKNGNDKKVDNKEMFDFLSNKLNSVTLLETKANAALIDKDNAETLAAKLEQKAAAAENKLAQAEAELKLSREFKAGLQRNYLEPFYAQFGGTVGMPPISSQEKKVFTETIYSLAFHVLSYCKQQQSESDKANMEAITNGQIQQYKEALSINGVVQTHQLNALIAHIVDELKRNEVQELKNVNYLGYGFTK